MVLSVSCFCHYTVRMCSIFLAGVISNCEAELVQCPLPSVVHQTATAVMWRGGMGSGFHFTRME
jgi:hypothetical protein